MVQTYLEATSMQSLFELGLFVNEPLMLTLSGDVVREEVVPSELGDKPTEDLVLALATNFSSFARICLP